VLSRRRVLQEGQDGAPPIRDERLTNLRKQAAVEDAGVLRTRILADVIGAKREQIPALPALEVDTAKPRARLEADASPLFGRNDNPSYDARALTAAALVVISTTLPGVTSSAPL
jgi:hypothetical protein